MLLLNGIVFAFIGVVRVAHSTSSVIQLLLMLMVVEFVSWFKCSDVTSSVAIVWVETSMSAVNILILTLSSKDF